MCFVHGNEHEFASVWFVHTINNSNSKFSRGVQLQVEKQQSWKVIQRLKFWSSFSQSHSKPNYLAWGMTQY